MESTFVRLSKSLKSKILATIVSPPGYTGFITKLPFELLTGWNVWVN